METKGVTCKIPLELHNQITEEMRNSGMTMSKFIETVINEHYAKGETTMATRTMAFQISEELFQKIKAYLAHYEEVYHRRLTQKEFVLTLIQEALDEADEDFEAAKAAEAEDDDLTESEDAEESESDTTDEDAADTDPDAEEVDTTDVESEVPDDEQPRDDTPEYV